MARSWQVDGTTGVQSVGTSGTFGACLVMVGGPVRCWGDNCNGQLATGDTTPSLTPIAALGLPTTVTSTSLIGSGGCAVTSGGVAYCWGANTSGSVGDGSTSQRLTPVEVLRP